jgi:hypothetical protein
VASTLFCLDSLAAREAGCHILRTLNYSRGPRQAGHWWSVILAAQEADQENFDSKPLLGK